MKRLLLMVCFVAVVGGVQGAKQYRDFMDTQGRTIRGCIVAYDAKKQIVTFERDDRKIKKAPITLFSEADQTYILEWEVLRSFAMERLFKISAKRKKRSNEEESHNTHNKKIAMQDTSYEIMIENRSASNFKDLKLEYCIYYEQEERSDRGNINNQGVYCGDLTVDSIMPTTKKVLYTEAVSTYTQELSADWYYGSGSDNVQRGDVHGIWIRVHLKLPSGETETRECCLPDSLKNSKAWMTSSIRAGKN